MITLSTSGNSVIFTFQDNQHYLQNGTIEVPKNSLMLVTDESNMATFKKSASNDIFLSALYSELGMSKSELEEWFEENATTNYGGGGTSGNNVVEVTQAEYDALVSAGTIDNTAFYIITDATVVETSGFVQTSAVTSSVTSASTDNEIPTAKAVFDAIPTGSSITTTSAVTSGSTDVITSGGVYDQLDGLKLEKVTQAEYDALVSGGTVDNNTLYVIS